MIVRERLGEFLLIEQHHHALISGVLAKNWKNSLFDGSNKRESVELAIKEHDACWKQLDKELEYIDETRIPASFTDYPLQKKIDAYLLGVNSMVMEDAYAGLLISLHYTSFFQGKLDPSGAEFKQREEERQQQLFRQLSINESELQFHFDLLQLCDNLSLYICMNEWGSSKEEEYPWFKNGFPQQLAPVFGEAFYTEWLGVGRVGIAPYPFAKQSVTVSIPYKRITKEQIYDEGLVSAYNKVEMKEHHVKFVPLDKR